MQFSSLFLAATAALISGSQAAAIPRADPHIVDFRTFGQPGCSADNQGIYTYTQSETGTCYPFSDVDTVRSIFVGDITEGCNGESSSSSSLTFMSLHANPLFPVYVYTAPSCTGTNTTAPVGIANCYSYADGLSSYEVVC